MKKIDNYIKEIRSFISVSKLTCDAWWTLAGENSKDYEHIRKKFPTHFELSKHAYLNTLIVTLYMTLESKNGTINIKQLATLIKKEKQFKQEHIKHIENEITNAEILWKKICILRSNQFAHYNYELSLSGAFKKANIKPIEFQEYIGQLESIMNYISSVWNGSTHAFNSDNKYNTKQFMDSLIKQKE